MFSITQVQINKKFRYMCLFTIVVYYTPNFYFYHGYDESYYKMLAFALLTRIS
jgi:hypothetical protein